MPFLAYVATRRDDAIETAVTQLDEDDLPPGEVLVEVRWSGLNFKDAMVVQPGNRVARRSPLVPGVDLAGLVLASEDPSLAPGALVLAHGYDIGVSRHGGFAEVARVPSEWVVPLPPGLDPRRAMAVGTAGFTALLSLRRLERLELEPSRGPVLVTGATGGVGTMAVALLAHHGYEVVASTGKDHHHAYLRRLGAAEVIGRDVAGDTQGRVLGPERFAAAVDCVGGRTLADALRSVRYGGAVAASGLTGGAEVSTTVYPFIVRGVSLLGIDSVQTPIAERRGLWDDVERSFPWPLLEEMVSAEIGLDGLDAALATQLAGATVGRVLLRP